MKKLLIIIVAASALAQCRKDIRQQVTDQEARVTTILKANNIDCKSCLRYTDSVAAKGWVINPAIFCENYCKYVKRIK